MTDPGQQTPDEITYRFKVSLRLWHPWMDPMDITEALALRPSRAWKAGQQPSIPSGEVISAACDHAYWTAPITEGEETSLV